MLIHPTGAWIVAGASLLIVAANPAFAQKCPDPKDEEAKQKKCLAEGGEWARLPGMVAYWCGIHDCLPRTNDGGKKCQKNSECEDMCLHVGDEVYVVEGQALGSKPLGRCSYHHKKGLACGIEQVDKGVVVKARDISCIID
jgi:hypothetical protein